MLKIDNQKIKILSIILFILLMPVIIPLISTIIEIIINFGRYVGTISRELSFCV